MRQFSTQETLCALRWRCALAYGVRNSSVCSWPGTYSSARKRASETWPGYYRTSLAGLSIPCAASCVFFSLVQRRRKKKHSAFSTQQSARKPNAQKSHHGGAAETRRKAKDRQSHSRGRLCYTGIGNPTTNEARYHFPFDSKQKVKYHYLISSRCRTHLWHCRWDDSGM